LFIAGVLHRDISNNNVLLAAPGADPRQARGILIDLDMAIMLDRDSDNISADFRTVSLFAISEAMAL